MYAFYGLRESGLKIAIVKISNIAAYLFVQLDDLESLRERVLEAATALKLKGTVLLAPEGINLFLAGTDGAVNGFLSWLKRDARFAALTAKYSPSESVPFQKLLVKIKREIIRMDHPQIKPIAGRAPALEARVLKRWLDRGQDDAGRELVLLDTRNAFEVDQGSFVGAVDYRIDKFTQFPSAVKAARADFAGKTVVSFCTGGIRCEKAALYMNEIGIDNVLQLEGGILKYFEEVGHAHYTGNCFVFDERRGVDSDLEPS
jgi:UPF0176 protein